MKQKSKKEANKKPKSQKWFFYIFAVLVALLAVVGSYIFYSNCMYSNMEHPYANSNDPEKQLKYIYEVRGLIDKGYYSVIFQNEFVPNLIKLLNSPNSTIQESSTRALMYLTKEKEKFALFIINEGAVPPLLQNSHSSNEEVASMALMTLYFMVEGKPTLGLKLVTMGLDKHLNALIKTEPSEEILNLAVSIILNLYIHHPTPSAILHQHAAIFVPVLFKLLHHSNDKIAKASIVTLLSITENGEGLKPPLDFDNEMNKVLIQLLENKDEETSQAALRILMYIVNSANQLNPDKEILELMPKLIKNDNEDVVQVFLTFILKSVHPSHDQMSAIFNANLIPLIVDKLSHKSSFIRGRAASILSTAAHQGKEEHLSEMLNMYFIPELYNILIETSDDDDKRMFVRALDVMIQFASPEMKMVIHDDFKKLGAFKELSKLLNHKKRLIQKWTRSILDSFSSENLETGVCTKEDCSD